MIEIISGDQLKRDIKELLVYLRVYILDPIHYIKQPPGIHWQSGIVFIFAMNIVFGIVRAIVSHSILSAIIGFAITPVLAALLMTLTTLFLMYFFKLVVKREVPFQTLFILLLIAYIPGALFFFGSILYAPLFVLGVVVTAALIVVGLVENFQIPKKLVIQLVVATGFLVLAFWVYQLVYSYPPGNEPKTLDELEQEIDSM